MKTMTTIAASVLATVMLLLPAPAGAHVPYFEYGDFSDQSPFQVRKSIEQSIAVYAWLDFDASGEGTDDIDVYRFTIDAPAEFYAQAIVPVCPGYEDLAPWFALVGPGLPDPPAWLPFDVAPGDGAIVVPNAAPGQPREMFYEPFGGKWYYDGPEYIHPDLPAGAYEVYYWDPYDLGGDYVAVLGRQEIWGLADIIRALINTPLIRQDRELHVECPQ